MLAERKHGQRYRLLEESFVDVASPTVTYQSEVWGPLPPTQQNEIPRLVRDVAVANLATGYSAGSSPAGYEGSSSLTAGNIYTMATYGLPRARTTESLHRKWMFQSTKMMRDYITAICLFHDTTAGLMT